MQWRVRACPQGRWHAMAMAAGAASAGGALTGPIKPPFQHAEWQGSVPSHWMDRATGYQRGKPLHHSDVRDGVNGVARMGFGPFAVDVPTRLHEESLRRTRQSASAHLPVAPWGDHPQEFKWRAGRRKLEDHEFEWRVAPKTKHAGLLAHGPEPERISKRPAFIERGGTAALPNVLDPEIDRCREKTRRKLLLKKYRTEVAEDRFERSQVLGLENWERSHLKPPSPAAAHATMLGANASAGSSLRETAATRLPKRSQSDTRFEFSRQRS